MHAELKKVYWPVVGFLIIQSFISSELFWLLGLSVCCYFIIIKYKGKVIIPFQEYKILFVFLIWGTLLGIIGIFQDRIALIDLTRDVFYYSNPLIFIYLGSIYAKKRIDIFHILNAIIISCGIRSLISIVNMVRNFSTLYLTFSVNNWRNIVGTGDVIVGITLAVILSRVVPSNKRLNKVVVIIIGILSAVYFFTSLSRTDFLIVIIIYTILVIKKDNRKKVIKIILGTTIGVVLMLFVFKNILPPAISESFFDKLLSSFTEISTNNTWSSLAEIQGNWRGYETHCATIQWNNYDFIKQIIGAGFGERIYVGKYAYTLLNQVSSDGRPIDSIVVLHNGYATQLIKLGVFGVIGYLAFYFVIIRKGVRAFKKQKNIDSRLLFSLGLVLLVQTYFLNGLFKDYCFFPIIILIGYTANNIQYKRGEENIRNGEKG